MLKQAFRIALAKGPGICAISMVAFKIFAGTFAYSTATLAPESATGHVVPVASHGRTIFLTQDQIDRQGAYHWSNAVLLGACLLVIIQAIRRSRHTSFTAGKRDC